MTNIVFSLKHAVELACGRVQLLNRINAANAAASAQMAFPNQPMAGAMYPGAAPYGQPSSGVPGFPGQPGYPGQAQFPPGYPQQQDGVPAFPAGQPQYPAQPMASAPPAFYGNYATMPPMDAQMPPPPDYTAATHAGQVDVKY